jgi:hypothetical protein
LAVRSGVIVQYEDAIVRQAGGHLRGVNILRDASVTETRFEPPARGVDPDINSQCAIESVSGSRNSETVTQTRYAYARGRTSRGNCWRAAVPAILRFVLTDRARILLHRARTDRRVIAYLRNYTALVIETCWGIQSPMCPVARPFGRQVVDMKGRRRWKIIPVRRGEIVRIYRSWPRRIYGDRYRIT